MANQLIQPRINQFLRPVKGGGEPEKINEIVILTARPDYKLTQAKTLIHEYAVEELRFEVADKYFDRFIADLQELRGASADELTTNP